MSDERVFASTADSVARARRFAVDRCAGLPKPIVDDIAIMVSELAKNAVRHAGSEFTVRVRRTSRRVRVEVTDRGGGFPSVRRPDPSEATGRGLQIVEALADSFGFETTRDGPGKTVWFVVELDGKKTSMSVREHGAGTPGATGSDARAGSSARGPGSGRGDAGGPGRPRTGADRRRARVTV